MAIQRIKTQNFIVLPHSKLSKKEIEVNESFEKYS